MPKYGNSVPDPEKLVNFTVYYLYQIRLVNTLLMRYHITLYLYFNRSYGFPPHPAGTGSQIHGKLNDSKLDRRSKKNFEPFYWENM